MDRAPHLEIDPWAAEARPHLRRCDHPECAAAGEYRAPKDRDRLREYFWFCLDHVRQYNLSWNYFEGMNEREIEHIRRRDTVWERPTWRLGGAMPHRVRDYFDLFEEDGAEERRASERKSHPMTAEEQALAVLDLAGPVTLPEIKARYKELVKRHHPDTNGGDKEAEERLKLINQAYTTLKTTLLA